MTYNVPAADAFTAFDEIELFGLSENGAADLPMPDDATLSGRVVPETFETFLGALCGTGLECEVEPLAHGWASLLFRRRRAIAQQLDNHTRVIQGLIRSADGSEVLETKLEHAQRGAARAREVLDAIEIMAERAAQCYEAQTNRAFIPASGSRSTSHAQLTGAVFEARQWLEAHEAQEAARFGNLEGRALMVAGPREWQDVARVWDILDKCRTRFKDSTGDDLVLYHKGDKWGVDAIAAAWAKRRGVKQVVFKPHWAAHGRAAGFKAIDQMLDTPLHVGGAVVFGATGLALNMGQKANDQGIKVLYVKEGQEAAGQKATTKQK